MIHWLVQSAASYPGFPDGVVVDGVLHPREQAKFASLKTEKRRQDWLLGRWTAKQLISEVVAQESGERPLLDTIEVQNGAMGDPIVNCQLSIVNWERFAIEPQSFDTLRTSSSILRHAQDKFFNLQSLISLSISHSNHHAFCAMVEKPDWPLGADIEHIEARSEAFVTDYFTKEECSLVEAWVGEMRDVAVTAVWSAKEAVLKALHLGLTVDTRSVACLIEPLGERPLTWTPFTIHCDNTKLPQTAPALTGWWRTYENFVLTLVVQTE